MTPQNMFGMSYKVGKIAGLITVGVLSACSCFAAPLAYRITAPITEIEGSDLALLGGAQLGGQLSITFRYDPDIIPPQGEGSLFLSPVSKTFATVSLGYVTYHMSEDFSLALAPHHSELNGPDENEIWSGDFVEFWTGSRSSSTQPVPMGVLARLAFPEGTLSGSPKLPDFIPTHAFLSFSIGDGADFVSAQSRTTGQVTFSPVPEPSTYGLIGSLALFGVVARKFKKTRRAAA